MGRALEEVARSRTPPPGRSRLAYAEWAVRGALEVVRNRELEPGSFLWHPVLMALHASVDGGWDDYPVNEIAGAGERNATNRGE